MPPTTAQNMWQEHSDVYASTAQDIDSPSADKPKKTRHRHSPHQLALLNELYDRVEHPSLEQRTSLAERLGMETKTVNAWFQNKRASNKKRNNRPSNTIPSAHPSSASYELPPISSLILASTSSSSSPSSGTHDSEDMPEYETHQSFQPPRLNAHPSLSLPMPPDPQQAAFYAGNPAHRHVYDSPNAPSEFGDGSRPKTRARPSTFQTEEMRKLYHITPHPTREEREALCDRIGMRYQSVTNWFQNQRSLAKRRHDDEETRAAASARSSRSTSKAARRYSPFPPAAEHPSISALLNREDSPAPSLTGSAVSSRGSPHPSASGHRPRRSRPAPHQLTALKRLYRQTASPSIEERSVLAAEIGMDLAKVTNWFRNLRQTSRKRKQKWSDDEESLRDETPSPSSSSQIGSHETDGEDVPMDEDEEDPHTDDEEDEEAVTPPQGHSPSPSHALLGNASPRWPTDSRASAKPVAFGDESEHGARLEDAMLLLLFHNTVVA